MEDKNDKIPSDEKMLRFIKMTIENPEILEKDREEQYEIAKKVLYGK